MPLLLSGTNPVDAFRDYLVRWQLIPDGGEIITPTGRLLPVRAKGRAAMLKVTTWKEEKRGESLLEWRDGAGAARVLARADRALLMERAGGGRSLVGLVRQGRDDEASRIICAVVAALHAPRVPPPPVLTPLAEWFKPLATMAEGRGGALGAAAQTAVELLASPAEAVPLHGDIHHANVLDFGPRGWLAVDPKGLVGERCFDYANIFCNPDFATAMTPGRFWRQIEVVADAAGLSRRRLSAWALAWAGLSAAFDWEDGLPTQNALALLETIAREVNA